MKRYDTLPLPISFASGETNERFRALTGRSGAWQDSLHAEDRQRVEALVERGRLSGDPVRFVARLCDHDGSWQTFTADGVAVDPSTYVLTWRELESEAASRFIAFMDHVPAVASLKDSEGRYLWVNRAFEAYTGLTIDALRGKTSSEWMPAEAAEASMAMALKVVAGARMAGSAPSSARSSPSQVQASPWGWWRPTSRN